MRDPYRCKMCHYRGMSIPYGIGHHRDIRGMIYHYSNLSCLYIELSSIIKHVPLHIRPLQPPLICVYDDLLYIYWYLSGLYPNHLTPYICLLDLYSDLLGPYHDLSCYYSNLAGFYQFMPGLYCNFPDP